jgi:uncharacterized protein involved in type VI secretion and phage assembly
MPDRVIVTIDGTEQTRLPAVLMEAVVDTNLYLPAMFSLTVKDEFDRKTEKMAYTDADTFKLGAEVKIEVETDEIQDEPGVVKATLLIGEITAVEPIFTDEGVTLLRVRGYDRSHRLTRGKKTRVYGDGNPTGSGINEEQIINTIVQETDGITAKEIDTSGFSSIKYPYVMQFNQTDWEFLWSRARQLGYQVYVDDKKLLFQKADAHRGAESDKPSTMRWGWSLTSFEPRLTLVGQVTEALVKGWDPKTKAAIEGTANTDNSATIPKIGLNKKGSALTKEAFKDPAEEVVVEHPVLTVDQAKAMAAARFAEAESEFIQADGHCRQGDPRLIAGRKLTIEGVGERFSGDYYVTEARHTYVRGRYEVSFCVAGRTPNTLMYLLNEDNGNGNGRGLAQGVVTAKVTSLEDPEELGRVQVMFPWLPKYKDADLSSNWARIATPMGGVERGFLFMPEIDDEVLVAFEHGDLDYPYIVGALWHNTDKPPKGTKASVLSSDKKKVDQRVIRSRSGHLIILDDTEGEEQIIIQDKTAKNSVVINSKENTMTINVEKDLTIVAKGQTSIQSTGNMTLKSDGDISIECNNLNMKAKANAKLEAGANLDLKATGQLNAKGAQTTVEGDAMTSVKSNSMVQVQSSALVKVQGNPIMLN